LEYFLIQLLKKQIDADIFRAVLDRPFKQGGVGLWKQKAEKITKEVEDMAKREESLKSLFERMNSNPNAPLKSEIEDIYTWLTKNLKFKITALQRIQMDELIEERVRNIITTEHFVKALNFPRTNYGVGLKIGTSLRLKDKLESILGTNKKEEDEKN